MHDWSLKPHFVRKCLWERRHNHAQNKKVHCLKQKTTQIACAMKRKIKNMDKGMDKHTWGAETVCTAGAPFRPGIKMHPITGGLTQRGRSHLALNCLQKCILGDKT